MVATVLELDRAIAAVGAVVDPEIPVLTIADLGILRDVVVEDGRLLVTITPTYSGCPAMRQIETDVEMAARAAGFADVEVRVVHNPPWTTDWMSPRARHALAGFGIAPPTPLSEVLCPRCAGSSRVASRFGSTACKALMVCTHCREPFDHFKEH